jgi:hypothetical protein
MNTVKKNLSLSYECWNPAAKNKEIKESHVQQLEEAAWDRIMGMIKQGYSSGELNASISVDDDDPEDGVEYSGYWEVKEL